MDTAETQLHLYGTHSSTAEYREVLARVGAFKTGGALRGASVNGGQDTTTGMLPAEWAKVLTSDESVSYIVWSYKTPIAWYSEIQCGWVIPPVKYSATTTQHQLHIKAAVS